MSNGAFQAAKYESDTGRIYNCDIQPETLTATLTTISNDEPAGAVSEEVSAMMKSGNKIGVNARTVRVKVTAVGTGPYAVGSVLTVPWLERAGFDGLGRGQTGTYNGADIEFVGKTAERKR